MVGRDQGNNEQKDSKLATNIKKTHRCQVRVKHPKTFYVLEQGQLKNMPLEESSLH